MTRVRPVVITLTCVLSVIALAACEKGRSRRAGAAFRVMMSEAHSAEQRAAALEQFTHEFPESKTNHHLIEAYRLLGRYHVDAGRPRAAAGWYEQAVARHPDEPDILNLLGYHYAVYEFELDRAVDLLERAVVLGGERGDPPLRMAFYNDSLGWAYFVRGEYERARLFLLEAQRLAPDLAITRRHLAEAYVALGRLEEAAALQFDLLRAGEGDRILAENALSDIEAAAISRGLAELVARIRASRDREGATRSGVISR